MNLVTIFSEEVMHALGWALIHSLWQGAIVALLLAIVLLFFRKSNAKFRYRLSVSSLFLAFALFVGTFLIFYFNAASTKVETILTGNEEVIEIIIESTNPITAENANFWAVYTDYFNTHLPFIVTLWFMGMVIFTLRFLGGLAYTQRLKHSQNSPMAFEWEEVMNEIKARFNITQHIQLVESKLVAVPMVIGYLKPMILLPLGVVNHLSISEVEAVLAHELAHIKRYDYLVNIIQSVIETLLFFHPAIWWISGEIRRERENCCDDLALEIVDSLTFAKALATLEQFRLNSIYQRKPQFSMAAITNKNQLLNRVQRILNQPQKNQNNFRGFFAACILVVSFLATSLDAQKVEPAEPVNESEVPTMTTEVKATETKIITAAKFPSIEPIFPVELEEPALSSLVEPGFPNYLEANHIEVIVSPNTPEFSWNSRSNLVTLPENTEVRANSIIKIKANPSKSFNDIVSITIRKDTSIIGEIKEMTIVRNVKDKNGKDAELKIEIKSVDGIKTVTTYENGQLLSKKDQQHYQSYIDESQAIANEENVRFSGDRTAGIRVEKEMTEKERTLRLAEAEAKRAEDMELAEYRRQLAEVRAKNDRVIVEQKRELTQLQKEQKERTAAIARERADIERELAEENKEIAKELQEQLKVLQAKEREMIADLAKQQVEIERQMAEQALEIARVKKSNLWIEKFKQELIKDDLLKENATKYRIKMDDKGIKVNGKKLSPEQEKKYLELYKSLTGKEWHEGKTIYINKEEY